MKTSNTDLGKGQFTVDPHKLDLKLLDPEFQGKIKRKDYGPGAIYTLRNLLSKAECDQLIVQAEKIGFQAAGLAVAQDVYRSKEKTRNNQRVMFEDENMAALLWKRMEKLVDPKFQNHQAYGLNWRFRVYKYEKGGHFAPHVDERMQLPGKGLITLFTFMVYLNENCQGGETTFFDRRRKGTASKGKNYSVNRVIRPKTGMGLAFDHLLFHEGSEVTRGVKYVLRSDLVYRK